MSPVYFRGNQLTVKNMKGMETTLQYHRTVKLLHRDFSPGRQNTSQGGSKMHVAASLCPFWEAQSWQEPICKQNSYGQAGKTEPEPHLVETGLAPLMSPKLCWFISPEKDQIGPGETAHMPSKGGGPCLLGVWFMSGISLNSTHMKQITQSSLFL